MVLVKASHEAAKAFDARLLTLATGAFGFSIAFVAQFAKDPSGDEWLFAAWASFGATALLTLASFLVSDWRIREAIRDVDDLLKKATPRSDGWQRKLIFIINSASIILFMIGVSTLAVFAWINLE